MATTHTHPPVAQPAQTVEACRNQAALALLRRMLDPEDLGWAVTAEVRNCARAVLSMPAAEVATP